MRPLFSLLWVFFALDQYPVSAQPQRQSSEAAWEVFIEPTLGTQVDIPRAMFSALDGASQRGVGSQFKTADGRAVLAVYSQRNPRHDTPASYLRKHFSMPRSRVDYERVTSSFFAISAYNNGNIYYSRCNFAAEIYCFDLMYPGSEKLAWDATVTRISRSLRPLIPK